MWSLTQAIGLKKAFKTNKLGLAEWEERSKSMEKWIGGPDKGHTV